MKILNSSIVTILVHLLLSLPSLADCEMINPGINQSPSIVVAITRQTVIDLRLNGYYAYLLSPNQTLGGYAMCYSKSYMMFNEGWNIVSGGAPLKKGR